MTAQGSTAFQGIVREIPGLICDSSLNTSDSANFQHRFVKMTDDKTVGLAGVGGGYLWQTYHRYH